jgi:hypothetical protein
VEGGGFSSRTLCFLSHLVSDHNPRACRTASGSGTTIEGTETDVDHLLGTGVATHPRHCVTATATGVTRAADATQGAPDGIVGLGVLLPDVMAIETGIGTAESETVRHLDSFLSFWLITGTEYGVYR